MRQPETFVRIAQPPWSLVCAACCIAMAVGKTLDELLKDYDWRELVSLKGFVRCLIDHGVHHGTSFVVPDVKSLRSEMVRIDLDPRKPAMVTVKSKVYAGGVHSVLWTGSEILDPMITPAHNDYEIVDVNYLNYFDDPELEQWEKDLPADWREVEHNPPPRKKIAD